MTSTRPADILRHLDPGGPDDRTLAGRYASHNDQAAFAELVRRHGPVVWAACLRVAGNRQDAEDAFQATFLVLVRKLAAVRNLDLLGNWLYGVAVRVAMKARRSAARRRAREVQVPTMPDPPDPRGLTPLDPDLASILDEELNALPAHYREALVLCDLRGVSRTEAATLLGIPEGTLSSRLANGRKKLAERLTRRGVALAAATVPGVLADAARAAVPVEVAAKVQHLVSGAAVPAAVARLASGGFSVKTTLLMGMMCATAVVGTVYAATPGDPPGPNDPPKPPVAARRTEAAPGQNADPKAEGKVAFTTNPKLRVGQDIPVKDVRTVVWSADGKWLAFQGTHNADSIRMKSADQPKATDGVVQLVQLKDGGIESSGRTTLGSSVATLVGFTPSGQAFITDRREYGLISGMHQLHYRTFGVDPHQGFVFRTAQVDLDSSDTHGYHFSADGKTFRTVALERDGGGAPTKLDVREVDAATGKTLRSLLKVDYAPYELSRNGKRLAVFDKDGAGTIYDVDGAKKLSAFKLPESPLQALTPKQKDGRRGEDHPNLYRAFSPDGRLLVVARDIGVTVVVKTDTGEALPQLEGTDLALTVPGRNAFSGDGRLLVLGGQRYVMKKGAGVSGREQTSIVAVSTFLTVWDTQTGKPLKSWNGSATAAFHPVRPVLAILEPNGDETRLGLWDFAADVEKK